MSGFTFKNLLGHYAKIFKCYDVAVKDCHQRLVGAFSVILKLETSRRFVSSSSKQITAQRYLALSHQPSTTPTSTWGIRLKVVLLKIHQTMSHFRANNEGHK